MLIRVSKNLITLNYARICINLNINFSSDTLEKEMVKMENSFILYVVGHHYHYQDYQDQQLQKYKRG